MFADRDNLATSTDWIAYRSRQGLPQCTASNVRSNGRLRPSYGSVLPVGPPHPPVPARTDLSSTDT